jgi:hypothetical protein
MVPARPCRLRWTKDKRPAYEVKYPHGASRTHLHDIDADVALAYQDSAQAWPWIVVISRGCQFTPYGDALLGTAPAASGCVARTVRRCGSWTWSASNGHRVALSSPRLQEATMRHAVL